MLVSSSPVEVNTHPDAAGTNRQYLRDASLREDLNVGCYDFDVPLIAYGYEKVILHWSALKRGSTTVAGPLTNREAYVQDTAVKSRPKFCCSFRDVPNSVTRSTAWNTSQTGFDIADRPLVRTAAPMINRYLGPTIPENTISRLSRGTNYKLWRTEPNTSREEPVAEPFSIHAKQLWRDFTFVRPRKLDPIVLWT